MAVFWCVLLVVILIVGWLMTWMGLPGNWLIVLAAAIYMLLVPQDLRIALGWIPLAAIILLAILGEIFELIAGALGVAKAGGSRRSSILALIGSMLGAMLGLVIGVPIPLIGSLVAAVIFGGLGALVGAALGEGWKGRTFDESLQVGQAAFVGRVLGTGAKIICGTLIVAVVAVALVIL